MNNIGNIVDKIPLNYILHKVKIYKDETLIYPGGWLRKKAWEIISREKDIKWKAIVKQFIGTYTFVYGIYYFKGDKFIKLVSDRGFEPIPPEWIIETMKGIRDRFFRERHTKVLGIYTGKNPIEPSEEVPYIIIVNRKEKVVRKIGYYRTSKEVLNNTINDTCECNCCSVDCKYRGKGYMMPPCSDIEPEKILNNEYIDYKVI